MDSGIGMPPERDDCEKVRLLRRQKLASQRKIGYTGLHAHASFSASFFFASFRRRLRRQTGNPPSGRRLRRIR
jgi:hypothetical protein